MSRRASNALSRCYPRYGRVNQQLPMRSSSSSTHLGTRPLAAAPIRRLSQEARNAPAYTYNIAAAFIGKGRSFNPSAHSYQFDPYNRARPVMTPKASRPESGHDAFFVSRVGETGAVALGVTDGVGGWVDRNVDPADFSHAFCDYMAARAHFYGESQPESVSAHLTAKKLMQQGYDDVTSDETIPEGGSTACVAVASPDGTLDVANLGDSGYLLLRLNGVAAYSRPQTHAFNTPYQLSAIPPLVRSRMAAFGGRGICDTPQDADVAHQRMQHGDVLVFATDGLWDNLFNQDVLRVASRVMVSAGAWDMSPLGSIRASRDLSSMTAQRAAQGPGSAPSPRTLQQELAVAITAAAKSASQDKKRETPFGKEVRAAYPNERWNGGKIDDICVVVAVVTEDLPPKSRL